MKSFIKAFLIIFLMLNISNIYANRVKINYNDNYILYDSNTLYFSYKNFSYLNRKIENLICDNKKYNYFKFKFKNIELLNINTNYFGVKYEKDIYSLTVFIGNKNIDYKVNNQFINYNTLALSKGLIFIFNSNYKNNKFLFNLSFNTSFDNTKGLGYSIYYLLGYRSRELKINYEKINNSKNQSSFRYIENPIYKKDSLKFIYNKNFFNYSFSYTKTNNKITSFESVLSTKIIMISNKSISCNINLNKALVIVGTKEISIEFKINDKVRVYLGYINNNYLRLKIYYVNDNIKAYIVVKEKKINFSLELSY